MPEDQALERLHAILARPEYQVDNATPWWQQLLRPVLEFVWTQLARVVQLVMGASTGREGLLGVVILVLAVLLLVGAAVYLLRALRLSVARESDARRASLAERRERSDQLRRAAEQLAASGQFAEATRLLYLSALYALDERAVLHLETGLTNREHLYRLGQAHPVVADVFRDVVDRYERVRYGRTSITAEGFAELSGRAQELRNAALSPLPLGELYQG